METLALGAGMLHQEGNVWNDDDCYDRFSALRRPLCYVADKPGPVFTER